MNFYYHYYFIVFTFLKKVNKKYDQFEFAAINIISVLFATNVMSVLFLLQLVFSKRIPSLLIIACLAYTIALTINYFIFIKDKKYFELNIKIENSYNNNSNKKTIKSIVIIYVVLSLGIVIYFADLIRQKV